MAKDGITPEMIEANERKATLISAVQKLLADRVAKIKVTGTPDMVAKAEAMVVDYIAKAQAQPAMFFSGHSLPTIMAALSKV